MIMAIKDNQVDFSKTTFYKGMNATYGKIPVTLEICLDIRDTGLVEMELSAGNDRMYRVEDIVRFLEAFWNRHPYRFSKNFILEPDKMYFGESDRKLLEFLYRMKLRWEYRQMQPQMLFDDRIIFDEDECERLLDLIWDEVNKMNLRKQPDQIIFQDDIRLKIEVEKSGSSMEGPFSILMNVDYTEYGNFTPLSVRFKYLYFEKKRLVVKLSEENREFFLNLDQYQNNENMVCFKIAPNELRHFQRNFLDKYVDKLGIAIDHTIKEEMDKGRLLTKIYFDIAPKGIISKVEFCYEDKVYNPLDDDGSHKSLREIDRENETLTKMKSYGFKEYERLFLLDDVEKIMFLLTDRLRSLKKTAEVYYSVDFKKLNVQNLDNFSFSLAEDDSVIHMNINLENVTDEELADLLDAIKKGKKYYRLKSGSIINLSSLESSKLINLINSLDINKGNINGGLFDIPLNRCMYIDNYLKEKNVENVKMDPKLGYLIKKAANPDEMEIKLPDYLRGVLRSYQLTGVRWLQNLADYSFGGILADDMGLGKTLQVLAFIAVQKGNKELPSDKQLPCIVVAPTSVIYNWEVEAEKFTPELKVLVITGAKEKRNLLICTCNEYDLIITTYGVLKNDIEDYRKIKFRYIFLDEAQNIKNPATLNANSVKSLTSKCAFALTGTPVENRLTELWSIFDFIMPGLLFNRSKFVTTYEEPIIKEKNQKKMEELTSIIKPFIIRRMKKDVLSELPEKTTTNYLAEMKEEQKKLYAAFYKDFKRELLPRINKSGITGNHIEVLTALTRLRQICAHPGTFLEDYNGGSGKLELAMEIIHKSIGMGHSILLFSQFTKMLKIIRLELEKNQINYYYLDGAMKPEDRMMEIDSFNNDRDAVFLISLKAGGTGLNLSKADIVIHFDPWWNPAVENQASDRAYRMGQKNVVQVYNLLTEGTIEEMIARMKERKKDLLEDIIKPEEFFVEILRDIHD